jgi:MFS family permease
VLSGEVFEHLKAIVNADCEWKDHWMLHEAAVSISDFALSALCAVLATRLISHNTEMHRVQKWFAVEIVAVAVAALLGGIVHGFVPDTDAFWGALMWRATLLFIGLTGMAGIMISSFLLCRPGTVERVRIGALLIFAVYCGIVLFEWQHFGVALAFYLPTAVLLFIAFLIRWRRKPDSFACDGLIAMTLTFIAGMLQHFRVAIHPVYFDHNVVYHLIQGFAMIFLYRAGSRWLNEPTTLRVQAA